MAKPGHIGVNRTHHIRNTAADSSYQDAGIAGELAAASPHLRTQIDTGTRLRRTCGGLRQALAAHELRAGDDVREGDLAVRHDEVRAPGVQRHGGHGLRGLVHRLAALAVVVPDAHRVVLGGRREQRAPRRDRQRDDRARMEACVEEPGIDAMDGLTARVCLGASGMRTAMYLLRSFVNACKRTNQSGQWGLQAQLSGRYE